MLTKDTSVWGSCLWLIGEVGYFIVEPGKGVAKWADAGADEIKNPVADTEPMPHWDWGAPGGPL
jgi:hypothetical protein